MGRRRSGWRYGPAGLCSKIAAGGAGCLSQMDCFLELYEDSSCWRFLAHGASATLLGISFALFGSKLFGAGFTAGRTNLNICRARSNLGLMDGGAIGARVDRGEVM